ncbi:MAG: 23S rRNA (pseudouridine(1915)-N(3))-methyltransferase RlmH, partial [Peptococcaceae bacterium]|nr:23S rRNA (pseudouridine(1915)-N(3))-methyltransferase RlmH [Peptococcaceae bacterium]
MLQLRLLCVGKVKEGYLQDGIREYTKRLSPLIRLQIQEVSDEPSPENAAAALAEQVKEKEAARILRLVRDQDYVILLTPGGNILDSPGIASQLEQLANQGKSSIVMIIGGSLGVSRSVKERADF